jgi:predicted thioesterase
VGTCLVISHLAATPVGETVEAVSEVAEAEGEEYALRSPFGRRGGHREGTHTRAVIDRRASCPVRKNGEGARKEVTECKFHFTAPPMR